MTVSGSGHNWQPNADIDSLRARAELFGDIRGFFARRGVLEVDTPAVSTAAATDPNLDSLRVLTDACAPRRYLFTSPEFPMKRLLAAGSGPIYQLGHVFRSGEYGAWHNPEFCMLEWYRPAWTFQALMAEVAELLRGLAPGIGDIEQVSFRQLVESALGLDPHTAPVPELRRVTQSRDWAPDEVPEDHSPGARAFWLDAIMGLGLGPRLGWDRPCFVIDFPACLAGLTRIEGADPPIARRFELYWRGAELANGGDELTDPEDLAGRFAEESARRTQLGLPAVPIDEHLLAAARDGLPACAGVALGVDRLLALVLGYDSIRPVLPFTWDRA